jgi:hypothetical protein
MMADAEALRFELSSEAAHWRTAVVGLSDVENFAAAQAWQALEGYLGVAVRRHLTELVRGVALEIDAAQADLLAAATLADVQRVRERLHRFRRRYLQAETVLEFYGHAVRSRTTTRLAELLRACDVLAAKSMEKPLRPLGIQAPPVLVYIDRGLGASILRAGLRLWDGGSPSPAAAVKLTRFNLFRPTSMLHEAGHQVAHLTGWNAEFAQALRNGISDQAAAAAWAGWATELGPDLLAFAHAGYGAVAALHDVVSAESPRVFSYPVADPHPIPWLRVLAGVEMCVRSYGTGPWDTLRRAWLTTHPPSHAPAELRELLDRCQAQLPRVIELGLHTPMRAFGGRALADVVDPALVSPAGLAALERSAGGALLTSSHYLMREGIRLLARSALDVAVRPERAAAAAGEYETWMRRLGALASVPEPSRLAAV